MQAGRNALDVADEMGRRDLIAALLSGMRVEDVSTLHFVGANDNAVWVRMLEYEGSEAVSHKALQLVKRHPHLRQAKDRLGRLVEGLAPKEMKDMIAALFCWHGR